MDENKYIIVSDGGSDLGQVVAETMVEVAKVTTQIAIEAIGALQESDAELTIVRTKLAEYEEAEAAEAAYQASMRWARSQPEIANWLMEKKVLILTDGLSFTLEPSNYGRKVTTTRTDTLFSDGEIGFWEEVTTGHGVVKVNLPFFGPVRALATITHTEGGGNGSYVDIKNEVTFEFEIQDITRVVTVTSFGSIFTNDNREVSWYDFGSKVEVDRTLCEHCEVVHDPDHPFANPQESEVHVFLG